MNWPYTTINEALDIYLKMPELTTCLQCQSLSILTTDLFSNRFTVSLSSSKGSTEYNADFW